MQPRSNITRDEVTDAAGDNRLMIRLVESLRPYREPGTKGYNFHSLVWEVRNGDTWAERLVISQADFNQGAARRWISRLHSLDPAAETAILQVGEEQPPDAQGAVYVEYSWREWDLAMNRQVRVLRVCSSSFEPLEGK